MRHNPLLVIASASESPWSVMAGTSRPSTYFCQGGNCVRIHSSQWRCRV